MAQKETILGNYLGFARFPLDCESIAYLQANTQLLSVIARLSGCDKLILSGCDITSGSTSTRAEGYVYIRTGNDLVGEVVYFKGGTGTRCKIVPTNFDVTANGETFRNAYTKRVLESSSSPSDMAWGDFAKLSDISNAALKTAVNGKAAASHTHAISNITGLQSALDGKAASNHTHNYSAPGHTHDDRYYTESEINTKLSGKSDINHTHNYSAPGHTHDDRYYTESEINTKLSGKSDINHTHNYSAPGHTHAISNITGLQSALDGKAASNHTHNYSAPGHTHDDRYYTEAEIDTKLATQEYTQYNYHAGTSNYVQVARIGRVVFIAIKEFPLTGNSDVETQSNFLSTEDRPVQNYNGVGFHYLGPYISQYNNNNNIIPFEINTDGKLIVYNTSRRTSFWANACYIAKGDHS